MTNAELAEMLNVAKRLAGSQAVTPNIIRQWVLWDLLPRATASASGRGQPMEWSRSGEAMRQAFRLAELRRYGLTRRSALIVQAFLEWGFGNFEDAQAAIKTEFGHARTQVLRSLSSDTRHDQYNNISRATQKALHHQAGPLDPRLIGTPFQLSKETTLRTLDAMVTGASRETEVAERISEHWNGMWQSAEGIPIDAVAQGMALGISGLFGDKEEVESPGQVTMENAPLRSFVLARYLWRTRYFQLPEKCDALSEFKDAIPWISQFLQIYNQLGPSIFVGPWAACSFAGILHYVEKKRKFKSI